MKYYIIIPAYNEEAFMSLTLQSLVEQTVLPTKIVVVNDNSTDKTPEIVSEFASKYPFITLVNKQSDAIHLPGSKVIQAFHEGEKNIDDNYDIIVKVDADLIFIALRVCIVFGNFSKLKITEFEFNIFCNQICLLAF